MSKTQIPPMVEHYLFQFLSEKTDFEIVNVGHELYHWFINYIHDQPLEVAMNEITKRNWHIHIEDNGWSLVTEVHGD